MKRWSSRRLFLLSQIWKVLQEILKSPLPVWLTGRLSLAGNSPKFNSSSASSSTQSTSRRVARAHRRANGALKPAPRWFLISQNHPRTVRLETPASAVDQIVSLIAVLSENPKYLRNIPKYCKQFKIFTGSKVSVTNAAVAEHLQSVLTSYGRG